ncbi:hypothetical protein NHG95_06960 [Pseudomonas corrugata]|uniref:hypothetical protein n=1 Tax=Pseudomonas corrugata TaxID=47879 RepID=UPI0028C4CAC1|nr:hypothetical protein [Pseudomonas corrugata]MDU9023371.1 hypothetical protein [Pseudomonas corrugata]MDU9032881.1 hypothetical protein [Pseudomonas corrugata]
MDGFQGFVRSLSDPFVYLGLLLVSAFAVKFRVANASSFIIWGCNAPLSFFCFFYWVYNSGGDKWALLTIVLEAFAFAQLGWIGCMVALYGVLLNSNLLKRIGFWVSVSSIALHGFFLGYINFFWSGS